MGVRADVETDVAKQEHSEVALEARVLCLIALEATRIALRADPVHIKVVRRAFVQALSIEKQRQWGSVTWIALQAGAWLVERTVPAWPVAIARNS